MNKMSVLKIKKETNKIKFMLDFEKYLLDIK